MSPSQGHGDRETGDSELGTTQAIPTGDAASVIGRYYLLQKIGEGGMGEVWLAEQREPVRRRVAVKLIKAGMNTQEVIARFESERQALALMEHPAIAMVLDAGSTPDGAPYFVMEHVAGSSITSYCDHHRLTTRERLELFIRVCEGVQHAHQKAIIHRDLKPSNILVIEIEGRAAPKIIDFGVAKALTHALTAKTIYTRLGALIGTPEYTSPEQARSSGEDIDTRTDIYSLGIILYELLAGAPPLDLHRVALDDFLRRLREEDPPKPSTRIRTHDAATSTAVAQKRKSEPLALVKEIRGDLDSIALKALEKDRSRRYGSASDFAADVRRYLNQEAVLAVPATAAYRARKYVRRNWIGVTAAAVTVVGVGTGTSVAVYQARVAQGRFEQVRMLANRFLFDFDAEIVNIPGTVKAREMIVSTALEYLNRLASEASGDPGLQWELATAFGKVAAVQGAVDRPSLRRVRDGLSSYERAFALARPLADRHLLTSPQQEALVNMLCEAEILLRNLKEFFVRWCVS